MARKKTNPFKGRTGAAAKAAAAATSQYGYLLLGDLGLYKEKKGTFRFDILPYRVTELNHPEAEWVTPEGLHWSRPFKMHRDIGSANEAVVCLSSIGKRCPICMARAELLRTGTDPEGAKALQAKDRRLYFIVPLGHADYEEKPHIWEISYYNWHELFGTELNADEERQGFPSLEDGLTISTRFAGKSIGKGKEFAQADRIDFEKRDEGYNEKILDKLPDLLSVLKILSFKELEAKFLEIDDEDEGGNEPAEDTSKQPETFGRPESQQETGEEPTEMKECVACEGSGENSKGNECPTCKGSGEAANKEDTSEAEEKQKRRQERRDKKKKEQETAEPNEEKCQLGHKFGVDTDDHPECEDCEDWETCMDAKDANEN